MKTKTKKKLKTGALRGGKTIKLWVGWDGSWVMSRAKIVRKWEPTEGKGSGFWYLSTNSRKKPSMVDLHESGRLLFPRFKHLEVRKMHVLLLPSS